MLQRHLMKLKTIFHREPILSWNCQKGLKPCLRKPIPSLVGTLQVKACTELPVRSARTCCWWPAGGCTTPASVTQSTFTTPPSLPQTLVTAAPSILTWILTSTMVQMLGMIWLLMVQKTPNSKVSPHQHQQKIITLCSEEEFLEIPQGQFLNGVNNGLYLTLDSEAFESSYDDEFSLSTGFLITLSYPFTRPIVKQKGPKLFT